MEHEVCPQMQMSGGRSAGALVPTHESECAQGSVCMLWRNVLLKRVILVDRIYGRLWTQGHVMGLLSVS